MVILNIVNRILGLVHRLRARVEGLWGERMVVWTKLGCSSQHTSEPLALLNFVSEWEQVSE